MEKNALDQMVGIQGKGLHADKGGLGSQPEVGGVYRIPEQVGDHQRVYPAFPFPRQLGKVKIPVEQETGQGEEGRYRTLGQVLAYKILKMVGEIVLWSLHKGIGMEEYHQQRQNGGEGVDFVSECLFLCHGIPLSIYKGSWGQAILCRLFR